MPSPELEAFREQTIANVEQVGTTLDPDQDWKPTLIAIAPTGLHIMPLVNPETGEDFVSQAGLPAITAAIIELEPLLVARIQMAWAATYKKGDERAPSERPDKTEILSVQIAEKGHQEFWISEVDRSGDHPKPSKWEKSDKVGGPMAEALQAAVEQAGRSN